MVEGAGLMKVKSVRDNSFSRYGRIVGEFDFSGLISVLRDRRIPQEVEYAAADPVLERLPVYKEFENSFYGGAEVQLGYCMGHNDTLNGLEYHKGSEVNISVTDYIVLIGSFFDLEPGYRYDTRKIEAFYVPDGLAVEFYSTTLHYCACHVNAEGYCHATFLPKGTNTSLDPSFSPRTEEDRLLLARNKWFIGHPEAKFSGQEYIGLYGPNWSGADLEM